MTGSDKGAVGKPRVTAGDGQKSKLTIKVLLVIGIGHSAGRWCLSLMCLVSIFVTTLVSSLQGKSFEASV